MPHKRKIHAGVTLLIAILILSTVLAVSFSLATILLAETRNAGDLLRTEPALYADNAISEEAIFNVSRSTGVSSYSAKVGALSVTSTSTPLNDPVQEVKIPSSNTVYGCTANCYVLYNPGNPYGPGGYGRIQVTFLNTNTPNAQLNVFLCQWDPQNPPKNANGTYKNICSDPTDTSYMTYTPPLIGQSLIPGQTFDTNSCGGCMDDTGNSQQELILTQTNGTPASNIYAQVSTWSSTGAPLGIPYFGETAVDISAANAGVSREVKVVIPDASSSSNGSASGFAHSRALTINSGQITGSQSNFPVMVCFNATLGNGVACPTASELKSSANGGVVQSATGNDIVFTSDSAGSNVLNFEQENYNPSTGEMEYWVNLPSAAAGATFYMFYDKAGVANQSNPVGVWNNGYVGVWHFPNGSSLSTINSVTGTAATNSNVTAATGQIDGGGLWNGSSGYLTTDVTNIPTSHTVSVWGKATNAGAIALLGNSARFIGADSGPGYAQENFSGTAGEWNYTFPSLNTWHYYVMTYNGSSSSNTPLIYIDGNSVTVTLKQSAVGTFNANQVLTIGNNQAASNNRTWPGDIDEVHISNVIESPSWIAAEYNNQSSPQSFYSIGAEN